MLHLRRSVRFRSRPRTRELLIPTIRPFGVGQDVLPLPSARSYHAHPPPHGRTTQPPPMPSPRKTPLFDKVLIANRGEIACRVIRTCRDLGIPTVALYSVADGPRSLHASTADEAYQIGVRSAPSESYLLQDEVLDIAVRSGATAIHPGYGFLSENAEFCEKVRTETNGSVAFVGPPAEAIAAMGSKSKSKAIMETAGVTTAPGFYGDSDDEQDPLHLLERAVEDVGFPLLIKAVMGGGGKGMRVVWSESDFLENLEACKRESVNAFGDDKVLLEKYLVNPRHVEVQVVADHHGNVVSLHERDCSLQRRHQKIIEEAPASDLSTELRNRLGEMGRKAAKAVGYVNAGTVEFLLESNSIRDDASKSTGGGAGFYFCEMNTRLQVEHPITEAITGIDLVEWQLLVAAGEPLPITDSSEIPCEGHAFEARIYAEKPGKGIFLPASGTVWHHDPPAPPNQTIDPLSSSLIRVDTGIRVGQEVGVFYDPMISKLIVRGTSRSEALDGLARALHDYRIAGVPTNIDLLIKCARHETFRNAGATHTGFLEDHKGEVFLPGGAKLPPEAIAFATFAISIVLEGRVGVLDLEAARRAQVSPWNSLSGSWRTFGNARRTLTLVQQDSDNDNTNDDTNDNEDGEGGGPTVECTSLRDGSFEIEVHGKDGEKKTKFHLDGTISIDHQMNVVVDGSKKVSLIVAWKEVDGIFKICLWPQSLSLRNGGHYFWEVAIRNPRRSIPSPKTKARIGSGVERSPMPGTISEIFFQEGDLVEEGDILVVMEAMKMEHPIRASKSGVVASIDCEVGGVVADRTTLAVIEGTEGEETKNADDGQEPEEAV